MSPGRAFRRSEHQDQLSTSQYYALRLAGAQTGPEEHAAILKKALKSIESNPAHQDARLKMVLTGAFCERLPLAMIEEFEAEGVAIVGDDMLLGQRWWTKLLPLDGNPIRSLAEFCVKEAVTTSVVHKKDPSAVSRATLNSVIERKADGVIVAAAKFCHPALSDIASIVKTCEENGVPYIRLEFEESMNVFAPIRLQIQALLEARAHLPFAGTESGGGVR